MQIECRASNGERCRHESHRFRIGVDSTAATEFEGTETSFHESLLNAIIEHVRAGRPGKPAEGLYLQVWTTASAKWRNVQNRLTGAVMAVTHEIVPETSAVLFLWACDSVQMARDLDVVASGLARESQT
jgi:hypothetical protein